MNDRTDLMIAIGAATIVMALLTIFIIYFILIYRKKQRDFQGERENFKQALLETEIEIKEQTLSDISRELHDNLGQIASLIKINLNLTLPDLNSENKEKIEESIHLTKQLIQDIRSLAVSLNGKNLNRFGLFKMIKKDLERYEKIGGLKINLTATEDLPIFEKATAIFLYRMWQEIFNNILKHAQASKVEIEMVYKNNVFELCIADNGIGYNTAEQYIGSGIINLNERCRIIGATLSIKSEINQGTGICIKLILAK